MNRNELIAAFQDTVAFSESRALRKRTAQAAASSKVYPEHFKTYKRSGSHTVKILVEKGTTFAAAKKHLVKGKTAVLNFANPVRHSWIIINTIVRCIIISTRIV